jgi:BlaI family transcriptional regulator, penicillinase repressor
LTISTPVDILDASFHCPIGEQCNNNSQAKDAMAEERLPDAELEVMACLWRLREATARQVREAMMGYRPMAHTSMVTLLGRLEAKGLVKRAKGPVGKAFLYTPMRRPGKTYRRVVGDVLQRIFGGNGLALVASLFETQPPTAAELVELQQLLDRLRQGTDAKG